MEKFYNTTSPISWGPEVAVDYESFYEKNKHDIETLGSWAYNRHPKSYPYLVAVSDDDKMWIGHPDKFFWPSLAGRIVVAHNAAHDEDVFNAGVERGAWPRVNFKAWYCTADMSTFLTGHRNLKDAVKALLGLDISKQVRADMNGKTWEQMLVEEIVLEDGTKTTFAQQVIDYAGDDCICLRLWKENQHKWPEEEKWLSNYNRERGQKGVLIDVPELERCIHLTRHVIAEAAELLPWVKRGRKQGSPIGVAEECRASNIPPPPVKSGPKGDPELAEEWLESYAKLFPWVKALKDLRSAKQTLAKLETMKERLRPDNTLQVSLLYCGAHTQRFAATGGLNFLNLTKEALYVEWDKDGKGVDLRGLLIPRNGKRFAIIDLSQIEPRCLNWIIGNEELLSKVRGGMAIYEAFARVSQGWTGGNLKKADKKKYALAKAQCVAEGTLVLTERGYLPIEKIDKSTKVWDGVAFVSHDGVVLKGERSTVRVGFEFFTDDHQIFSDHDTTESAGSLSKGPEAAQLYRHASSAGWGEVWALGVALLRAYTERGRIVCLVPLRDVWWNTRNQLAERVRRKIQTVQKVWSRSRSENSCSENVGKGD